MTSTPGFFAQLQASECRIHIRKFQWLCRIEKGDATSKDLDLLLEIAGSMGIMPGTTICGLADGNNWTVRTIVNKNHDEFEARDRSVSVPVGVTMGEGWGSSRAMADIHPCFWYENAVFEVATMIC